MGHNLKKISQMNTSKHVNQHDLLVENLVLLFQEQTQHKDHEQQDFSITIKCQYLYGTY